jgi:hypothetical protein
MSSNSAHSSTLATIASLLITYDILSLTTIIYKNVNKFNLTSNNCPSEARGNNDND